MSAEQLEEPFLGTGRRHRQFGGSLSVAHFYRKLSEKKLLLKSHLILSEMQSRLVHEEARIIMFGKEVSEFQPPAVRIISVSETLSASWWNIENIGVVRKYYFDLSYEYYVGTSNSLNLWIKFGISYTTFFFFLGYVDSLLKTRSDVYIVI